MQLSPTPREKLATAIDRGGAGHLGQPVVWVKSMLIENFKTCRTKLIFEKFFPYFGN